MAERGSPSARLPGGANTYIITLLNYLNYLNFRRGGESRQFLIIKSSIIDGLFASRLLKLLRLRRFNRNIVIYTLFTDWLNLVQIMGKSCTIVPIIQIIQEGDYVYGLPGFYFSVGGFRGQ